MTTGSRHPRAQRWWRYRTAAHPAATRYHAGDAPTSVRIGGGCGDLQAVPACQSRARCPPLWKEGDTVCCSSSCHQSISPLISFYAYGHPLCFLLMKSTCVVTLLLCRYLGYFERRITCRLLCKVCWVSSPVTLETITPRRLRKKVSGTPVR